jgi:hypothetical protein
MPACLPAAEYAVGVDADDGADLGVFGLLQLSDGVVEVGAGEAPLGEQGPGLGAVRRVEPIARLFEQTLHGGKPRSVSRLRRAAARVLDVLCLMGGAWNKAMTGLDHFCLAGPRLRRAAADVAGAGLRPKPICRAISERSAA